MERAGEGPGLWARLSGQHGRLLVAGVIAAYFALLGLLGGQSAWNRLGVPDIQPSFADMRSLTSAWECDPRGVSVFRNPCDPYYGGRPANYPKIWLWPSALGLGQGATVALGVATAIIFFASFLVLIGNPDVREAALYAAAAVSPAVMLGVERGNVDLLLFAMVVAAVFVFRRGLAGRLAGYALLLFAAILKLFPALAWGLLLRQPRRLAILSGAAMIGVFAIYVAATYETIRLISETVAQTIPGQYGADVGIDRLQAVVRDSAELSWLADAGNWSTAAAIAAGTSAIALQVLRRWPLGASLAARGSSDFRLDAFIAGSGVYVFSFVLWHNWDYRLTFLLMTLPQLIAWAQASRSPAPMPRLTLAALLGTLWLSELSGRVALDEILNWILFVSLGTGLVLATVPFVARSSEGCRARGAPAATLARDGI